jgi:dUTP pyrophosphatase
MSIALVVMNEFVMEAPSGVAGNVRVEMSLSEGAMLPRYATPGSAGLDLCSNEAVRLAPMQRVRVNTGVRAAIPHGFEGQVRPRSGLALNLGIGMVNSIGTIDSDYRGEIGVLLINFGSEEITIDRGERIAQLVICPVAHAEVVQVEEVPRDTQRGEGGFGSTGTR